MKHFMYSGMVQDFTIIEDDLVELQETLIKFKELHLVVLEEKTVLVEGFYYNKIFFVSKEYKEKLEEFVTEEFLTLAKVYTKKEKEVNLTITETDLDVKNKEYLGFLVTIVKAALRDNDIYDADLVLTDDTVTLKALGAVYMITLEENEYFEDLTGKYIRSILENKVLG